jgi:hypothetical protein
MWLLIAAVVAVLVLLLVAGLCRTAARADRTAERWRDER